VRIIAEAMTNDKAQNPKRKRGERSVVAEFISASPRAGTSPAPTGNTGK